MQIFSDTSLTLTQEVLLLFLSLWTIFWKGTALWKSAKFSQKYWFIFLLVVNTFGFFEIVYVLFFQREPYFKYFQKRFVKKKKTAAKKKNK